MCGEVVEEYQTDGPLRRTEKLNVTSQRQDEESGREVNRGGGGGGGQLKQTVQIVQTWSVFALSWHATPFLPAESCHVTSLAARLRLVLTYKKIRIGS